MVEQHDPSEIIEFNGDVYIDSMELVKSLLDDDIKYLERQLKQVNTLSGNDHSKSIVKAVYRALINKRIELYNQVLSGAADHAVHNVLNSLLEIH